MAAEATAVQAMQEPGLKLNTFYRRIKEHEAGNSYLDLQSKSLNNMTYNGSITRAEAIYTLISRYYSEELKQADPSNVQFSDAKDGGDIAAAQKFIEDGKTKDYWKSYELTYALQNADDGLPTDLYKAIIVAQQQGLIGSETRWDEAITLSEAMELLVKALMNEKGVEVYTAKLGTFNGYEVQGNDDNNGENSLGSNATIEGNGNGVDVILPEDFPYVDREAGAEQTPAPEIVEQPKVEEPKQEVQQPVQTSTPINSMPTHSNGSDRNNSGIGTGAGEAYGQVGTFE